MQSPHPPSFADQPHIECLNLTKALQKTADTLQTVSNLYEGHVRQTCFRCPPSVFFSGLLGLTLYDDKRLGEHNWPLMNP